MRKNAKTPKKFGFMIKSAPNDIIKGSHFSIFTQKCTKQEQTLKFYQKKMKQTLKQLKTSGIKE